MSSQWGSNFKISLFGESHGVGIGAVIDGVPSGVPINVDDIRNMMSKRAPGKQAYSTQRKEQDHVEILSGIYKNFTTGTPISGIIYNKDMHSKDYKDVPLRPSHADYTGLVRYNMFNDPRGGGHFSGRLTAPLVFAGSIAKQILSHQFHITVGAQISSIYHIKDTMPNSLLLTTSDLLSLNEKEFAVFNDIQGNKMKEEIELARNQLDSLGGTITCYALDLPPGIGSPIFDGLENKLASILFGIPAVRGVEFGTGFEATKLRGSEHNDPYTIENNRIMTTTNHHGGIIGGISSGMPLVVRIALKPTASIAQKQKSVDYQKMEKTSLEIHGRHDPCIVPRSIPVIESAVSIALLDSLLEGENRNVSWKLSTTN